MKYKYFALHTIQWIFWCIKYSLSKPYLLYTLLYAQWGMHETVKKLFHGNSQTVFFFWARKSMHGSVSKTYLTLVGHKSYRFWGIWEKLQ